MERLHFLGASQKLGRTFLFAMILLEVDMGERLPENSVENGSFNIMPCDIDIENKKEFVRLHLDETQKIQIGALIQHIPSMMTAKTMSQAFIVSFPNGVPHTLMQYKNGGVGSAIVNDGNIIDHASFHALNTQAIIFNAFTVMSIASGQYFLSRINNELNVVKLGIDRILEFLYGDKKAELMSEISFVKYAYQNYNSIMQSHSHRIATIATIQEAKKVAMKDIEFYINDLDSTVNSRDGFDIGTTVNKAFQIKDSLELSMQLLLMSNVLEVYYSQNYDKLYLQYIEKEAISYLDKCEKRMLSSFSVLHSRVREFKGKIWEKIDKSAFEDKVGKIVDLLNSSEESQLKKSLHTVLQPVQQETKYYITTDGNIYLKTA